MVSEKRRLGTTIKMLLLVSVSVLILAAVACESNQDVINQDVINHDVMNQDIINLPPSESADKGNPKLDSQLNQLVSAERSGEAALFAEQCNIELFNNDVRVILECVPGQLEAATQEAINAGARIEASYDNLLQVVVTITSLSTLADSKSIRFIRLPQRPLPAPNN